MPFVLDDLAILAAVLSAGADIAGGFAADSASESAAGQYEHNAQLAKTGADQAEAARRRDLIAALSATNAIRAGRGLDVSSPTGLAIAGRLADDATGAIAADRLNALNQAQAYENRAALARNQGQMSLLSGFLRAGTSGFKLYLGG